jgi:hypothetical protein
MFEDPRMNSPFPGMDPYLKDQGRWTDFHASIITYRRDHLSEQLPEDYVAQIVTLPLATAVDEVRETWIEMRRLPDERLVTAIEILSSTDKGSSGLDDYATKRARLLSQPTNLIEVDLLLSGRRLPMGKPLPTGDFDAIVSRAANRGSGDVYASSIRRPLPAIPIPLEEPDPDAPLDLAELFALACQRGRYARLINYEKPLTLPLRSEDKQWAESIARRAISGP